MRIAVLGPVTVDGETGTLAPRERVILAALSVRWGEAIRAEVLAHALWVDSPPASWLKVVQGCVVRLRKVLGPDSIDTRPQGYALTLSSDEIDTYRFERLVGRASELMMLGESDRAGYILDEALSLWRGRALVELEEWQPGRVEAERLEELRRDAEELRLDAALQEGHWRQALAEAKTRVTEAPLREHRWTLLALAQYQAGRQGDALRTLHRARTLLAEELGLDPGPDIVALEDAILRQDPSLIPSAAPQTNSMCPYLGLVPYDLGDSDAFFGREEEVSECLRRLTETGALAVMGPSGSGKSSLVRAGVAAALERDNRRVVVITPGAHPMDALTGLQQNHPPVLMVDQCEEAVTLCRDSDEQARFFTALSSQAEHGQLVVALRADRLGELSAHPQFARIVEQSLYLLKAMDDNDLRSAIEGPARQTGLLLEPGLVDLLVRDVEGEPGALPLLSHALRQTWERREGRTMTVDGYQASGGIRGAVAKSAEEVYEAATPEKRPILRDLLLRLVAPSPEGDPVRSRVPRRVAASDPAHEQMIEELVAARLVTSDEDAVELAHEAIARAWPRLREWLDDDVEGQRIWRHLSAAADAWESMGRPDSELYRGIRLARAMEWRHSSRPDLNPSEIAFLDASWGAAEESRVQKENASRIRRLVIGTVGILAVVAVGLGVFALSERQGNQSQARIVRAADLAAAAIEQIEKDPELSILLAMEAVRTTRTVDGTVLEVSEDALHRAVLAQRLMGRVDHNGQGIAHFSPDGRSFVTSAMDSSTIEVWSVDPFQRKLSLVGHTDEVIDAVFNPTGSLIASASAADGTVRVWDSTTGELETTFEVDGASPAIPVFSNDGARIAATDFNGPIWVWDLNGRSVMELDPPEGTLFPLNLEFSPDDLLLAVTRNVDLETEETGPMIFDLATGELVQTLEGHEGDVTDIGFTPDGNRVVTSGRDGAVRVWELESGEVTGTFLGHADSVQDLEISEDGSVVASSGAVDVMVWDLETLETTAAVYGHRGTVDGIDLSPDGDLLLTASSADGTTRLWDLTQYWSHEVVGLPGPAPARPGGITFSPDGGILAASRDVDLISLWDTSTWDEIESLHSPNQRMAFVPDGSILAAAGSGGVDMHKLSGERTFAEIGTGTFANDVAFGPDGLLVTATADGVHIWRPPSYEFGELISSDNAIDVAIEGEGRFVASAHQDDVENYWVEIRRVDGGDLLATLSEGNDPITALAFDGTGERLLSGGLDTTGTIWDATDFTPLHQLEGHTAAVHAAATDPTRSQVATASLDGTIRIWDTETGMLRLTLPAPGALTDVTFSPNGRHVAAISPEGFVTVYTLHLDELLEVAQSRLTRGWTKAECFEYLQTDECPQTEDGSFNSR
jgi:WD40 repeat protein/DNA-binding SARP family transcriptional activator